MLKKSVIIFLVVFLVFTACFFTGCEEESIEVESIMNIDESFSGKRVVDVVFPLSVDIDALLPDINGGAPAADGVVFEYVGVENDGYHFQLNIDFDSKSDYEKKITAILGREAGVDLGHMDSVLTRGIIMKEDFDNSDLIYWIPRVTKSNPGTSSLMYKYNDNTISIEGEIYTTGKRVNIMARTGEKINSITIDTTNSKDDTYDRTITFSIPNDTYNKIKNKLDEYFLENTMPQASYYGWADKGENKEYSVIYEDLSIEQLSEYTGELLDTENETVFYGDKDNDSTPLSEGLTFEENFNTFAFIGAQSRPVKLIYNYALPTVSTHGEGTVKSDGKWIQDGSWNSGVFTAEFNDDVIAVKIPDGIQYSVKEINFLLQPVGNNEFRRTTEFVYQSENAEAFEYAVAFFEGKGADIETEETGDTYICRVISSGTSGEISDELVTLFGGGNSLSYSRVSKALSLSDKTRLTDTINMGHLLSEANQKVPMKYTVVTGSDERIFTLLVDGKNVGTGMSGDEQLSADVTGGQAVIEYSGNIPNVGIIITFITIFMVILMMSVLIIVLMNVRRRPKINGIFDKAEEESGKSEGITDVSDDRFKDAPYQTTMFKISDLFSLKNRSSEKDNTLIETETQENISDEISSEPVKNEECSEINKEPVSDEKSSEEKDPSEDIDERISILKYKEESDEDKEREEREKDKVFEEKLTKLMMDDDKETGTDSETGPEECSEEDSESGDEGVSEVKDDV